ncbi:MAG: glycine cleavage system aminomethyltransferase GcvT [Alphaproteobacteria bacterium]|nr:glycine cleavage system aminomethyltransferase GcvT [Alphaproteobacteria bacterium]
MLRKTALHQSHIDLGAKMGEFAGYDMPLYYGEGVIKEHEWVRSHCGLFDVSHMGQITIEGEGVAQFLEKLTPSAFQPKAHGRAQYTVLLNEEGGIIDDLIITRIDDNKFFAVINAGCKDKDIEWIKSQLPSTLKFKYLEDNALIAIQGNWAERILHEVLEIETDDLPYMHMMQAQAPNFDTMYISRVGYTGEDGFEISVPNACAEEIWSKLLDHSEAKPIGLAARDSLRLEMGYALYGHEINAETSPVEAGLSWVISKKTEGYFGYDRIAKERENGTENKLVAVKLIDKGVARDGAELRNEADEKIGWLTSGGFSPTLKESIGIAYIKSDAANLGDKIFVNVRGRNIAAEIAKTPFLPAKTKSMKKKAA